MKLGAEIGLRLLKSFYWGLWVGEFGAVALFSFGLLNRGEYSNIYDRVFALIAALIVVTLTHYILTIPIGKKLAEIKAND
jgi:hypothetical protein